MFNSSRNKKLVLLSICNLLLCLLILCQVCCVVSSSKLRGVNTIDRAQIFESPAEESIDSFADLKRRDIVKKICMSKIIQYYKGSTNKYEDVELPIRLQGVFITPYRKVAFVEDLTNDKEVVCGVGDVVAEARILNIAIDKVEVEFDGKIWPIFVKKFASNKYEEMTPSSYDSIIYKSGKEVIVERNALAHAIKGDITNLLSEFKIKPLLKKGHIEGFVLRDIKKGGLVDSAQFKDGDVIRSVNGQKLDGFQKTLQIFKKIKTQPIITVDVLRDNELKRLVYRVK